MSAKILSLDEKLREADGARKKTYAAYFEAKAACSKACVDHSRACDAWNEAAKACEQAIKDKGAA